MVKFKFRGKNILKLLDRSKIGTIKIYNQAKIITDPFIDPIVTLVYYSFRIAIIAAQLVIIILPMI